MCLADVLLRSHDDDHLTSSVWSPSRLSALEARNEWFQGIRALRVMSAIAVIIAHPRNPPSAACSPIVAITAGYGVGVFICPRCHSDAGDRGTCPLLIVATIGTIGNLSSQATAHSSPTITEPLDPSERLTQVVEQANCGMVDRGVDRSLDRTRPSVRATRRETRLRGGRKHHRSDQAERGAESNPRHAIESHTNCRRVRTRVAHGQLRSMDGTGRPSPATSVRSSAGRTLLDCGTGELPRSSRR